MKRLSLPRCVAVVAVVVSCGMLAGCDALGDDVAATVGDTEITVKELKSAIKDFGDGIGTADPGLEGNSDRLNGVQARNTLSVLVKTELFTQLVKANKGSVTDADTSSAEEQVAQSGLSAAGQKRALKFWSAEIAAVRVLSKDSDLLDSLVEEAVAAVDESDRMQPCFNGLVGASQGADAAQQLLDSGTKITDAEAFTSTGFQALTADGSPYCAAPSELKSAGKALAAAVVDASIGELGRVDYEVQGTQATLFFVKVSVEKIDADSTVVRQRILNELKTDPTPLLKAALKKVDVSINSKYGSKFDPTTGSVTEPATAEIRSTPTTAPRASK